MSVDLKTLTPDSTINDSAVLFGADSQASASPSVYAVSTVRQHIAGTANTFTQPQIISANSATDALRITQTGAGNALVVEDSANPDATPFVIDQNGVVVQGSTTPITGASSIVNTIQTHSTSGAAGYAVSRWVASSADSSFQFLKSRGSAVGTRGIVSNGDSLGQFFWAGDDGVSFITAASVRGQVDGTPGVNDMPGRILFFTTAAGTSSPVERMRITNAGRVGIGTTAPAYLLDVAQTSGGVTGAIRSSGTTGSDFGSLFLVGGTYNSQFQQYGNGPSYYTTTGTAMFLQTSTAAPIVFVTNGLERARLDTSNNLLLGTTASPTTGTQCLTVETGTAPTATPADTISVYSSDLSAGNTILSLYTEGTPVNANTTAAATHRIAVRINGTVYYLLANTAA